MANLAGFFDFLSPLFQIIIKWLYNLISNYGWTIVIFTVALKLITMPLDLWVKISSKKTQILNAEMKPELERLQVRYGNNRSEFQQKQMELYRKHGFSPVGGCLPVIINLLLVLFLYVSMYNAMNVVSVNIAKEQFLNYETTYDQAYNAEIENGKSEEDAKASAQNAVYNYYKENPKGNNSFLWIKNISYKDSSAAPVADFTSFKKLVGGQTVDENENIMSFKFNDEEKVITSEKYTAVMGQISLNVTGWNGYFILPVLVIGFSFLASFIPEWLERRKLKGLSALPQQSGIMMKLLMPVLLGVLCFTTNATFGIYLLANTLIGIATGFVVDPIANNIIKKFILKKKDAEKPKISYSR